MLPLGPECHRQMNDWLRYVNYYVASSNVSRALILVVILPRTRSYIPRYPDVALSVASNTWRDLKQLRLMYYQVLMNRTKEHCLIHLGLLPGRVLVSNNP